MTGPCTRKTSSVEEVALGFAGHATPSLGFTGYHRIALGEVDHTARG